MESLAQWLEREYRYAASAMLESVSARDLIKTRPGFGQRIRAAPGSIVGSPVLASYDPDPDYFFHWYRDAALVVDALRQLYEDRALGGEALDRLGAFVRFSAQLAGLDGRVLIRDHAWRGKVAPDFVRYLREDAELARVHGEAVAAEARVNPDGTLDISKWSRPQHDGAPLRALALLRWVRGRVTATTQRHRRQLRTPGQGGPGRAFKREVNSRQGWQDTGLDEKLEAELAALIRSDLAYTFRHGRELSFDIWEEELGRHYYTLRVSAAALEEGAAWLDASGDEVLARIYRAQAAAILRALDGFWLEDTGHYASRMIGNGARSAKEPDVAVILAAIHARGEGQRHSVRDPRMHATLDRLEALFDARYPINRARPAGARPALGRYRGDAYYGGGAWYVATLGAAEFCYRAARSAPDARAWIERGDGFLATVRAYTPGNGELSEQFDPRTGAQTSAKHLAWSYAAFITCAAARRAPRRAAGAR